MREIQLRDAKATLSAVVDEAVDGQPSVITRRGKREAVIISFAEWEKLSHIPSFGRLLMSAPLEPGDIAERSAGPVRETDLLAQWEAVYLVDTNVLSAAAPSQPRVPPQLIQWMETNSERLFLSVITIAEVEDGIAKAQRLGAVRKAAVLREWLELLIYLYDKRILALDDRTARLVGRLADVARSVGQAPGFQDLAIAATAKVNGLTVLTRNLRHFTFLGVDVHDPFEILPE